jgi:energy-coupling factor transporter ATP-binding protein EcfA2
MLEQIKLTQFRCYKDYTINFDKFNIIVGKNDVGKSTIIDALKLISNVRRFASRRKGQLEDRDVPFSQINLRHNYAEEEVKLDSKFSDETGINIVFPYDENPYASFFRAGEELSNRHLGKFFKHSVGIIPPVGTFEEVETVGDMKYLKSILISHLTPRHFRNIWSYFDEGFEEFQELIETTWPGYTIYPPEVDFYSNRVNMFFNENGYDREIFWAGHGFQIWLQLMTFLVKLGKMDTLVLDEPDIYLHSDMQKKLINICKERSNQVIVASHAVDIIEEVDPDEIILVDKSSNISRRLSNVDEVQTCINQLGSCQNLKLVHLLKGKTCLFLEGNEFRFLKKIAKKIDLESFANEDGFSIIEIEGFSNWKKLLNVNWIFKNTFGEKIKCYAILDRDYHTEIEIEEIKLNLQQKDVKIHVWEKKEIENYAINSNALYRMFIIKYQDRYQNLNIPLSEDEFDDKIVSIFEEFKEYVQAQIIARRIDAREDKAIDPANIISEVLEEFPKNWENVEYRRKVIPGKDFFNRLNAWLNDEYHIAISINYAFNFLQPDEIDTEITNTINDFIALINSNFY